MLGCQLGIHIVRLQIDHDLCVFFAHNDNAVHTNRTLLHMGMPTILYDSILMMKCQQRDMPRLRTFCARPSLKAWCNFQEKVRHSARNFVNVVCRRCKPWLILSHFVRITTHTVFISRKFKFLEHPKSNTFRPMDAIPTPYESPASVVYQDLLSLSVRHMFLSKMTSETTSSDASQGNFDKNG